MQQNIMSMECTLGLRHPLRWQPAFIVCIVKDVKGEHRSTLFVVADTLFLQQLGKVLLCKQTPLPVQHDCLDTNQFIYTRELSCAAVVPNAIGKHL